MMMMMYTGSYCALIRLRHMALYKCVLIDWLIDWLFETVRKNDREICLQVRARIE